MTTSIRSLPIHVAPTTDRKAERGRFENALRGAADGAAHGIAQTIALAAPLLPGGPVLAGAVRGALSPQPSALGPTTGGSAPSPASASLGSPLASPIPASFAPGGAAAGGDLVEATRALQTQAQAFNLQYLQLQEGLQRESREFTAVSNVMKVRHETAKSAIQNIH
jgi:hypothetical protein